MLYGFVSRSKEKPTLFQLKHSVLRNFGGLEVVDPVAIFLNNLSSQIDGNEHVCERYCQKLKLFRKAFEIKITLI